MERCTIVVAGIGGVEVGVCAEAGGGVCEGKDSSGLGRGLNGYGEAE